MSVDSEVREIEVNRAIKRGYRLDLELPDDQLTHVIVAEYLAGLAGAEKDYDTLAQIIVTRRSRERPTILSQRLIGARARFEAFYEGDLPRNVPGWTAELIEVAHAHENRSELEIAVAVWAADRGRAKARLTPPPLLPPSLEFDHRLLGFGKYAPVPGIRDSEPFFEFRKARVSGYCGVNRAWMYVPVRDVDDYGSLLVEYFRREWPSAWEAIEQFDRPLGTRPLGFHSIPLAAEAFSRHLTVEEGATFLFEQVSHLSSARA